MSAETWWHLVTVTALVFAVAAALLAIGLARAVAVLTQSAHRMTPADRGLVVDASVPAVLLPARFGAGPEPLLRPGIDQLVLFLSPTCSGCTALASTVQPALIQGNRRWDVVLIVCGAREQAEGYTLQHIDNHVRVLFDYTGEAELAFATGHAYPFGFAVSGDGIVRARGLAARWELARQIVAEATLKPHSATIVPIETAVAGSSATARR